MNILRLHYDKPFSLETAAIEDFLKPFVCELESVWMGSHAAYVNTAAPEALFLNKSVYPLKEMIT